MAANEQASDLPDDPVQVSERDDDTIEFVPPPPEPPSLLPPTTVTEAALDEEDRFQFYVSDLLILTFGIAAGFAGGRWIPAELFSFLMGSATVAGIIIHYFRPPTRRWMVVMWITILAGYIASIVAVVLKTLPVRPE